MEDNIILKDQISMEEALNMIEVQTQVEEEKNIEECLEEDKYAIKEEYDTIYHFNRIKECKEFIKSKEAIRDRRIAEAMEWCEQVCKEPKRKIDLSKWRLETYYKEQKASNPKYKLSVPGGSLTIRKILKADWKASDEEVIINYLKENHSAAIKIQEEIDKKAFKKMYTKGVDPETGEVIPGYELIEVESPVYSK